MELVCPDLWKTHLRAIRRRVGKVLYVLDRFHVAGKLGYPIDKVRATEARELEMQGLKPLKRNRWPLLWHLENRCESQQPKLADLLTLSLPPSRRTCSRTASSRLGSTPRSTSRATVAAVPGRGPLLEQGLIKVESDRASPVQLPQRRLAGQAAGRFRDRPELRSHDDHPPRLGSVGPPQHLRMRITGAQMAALAPHPDTAKSHWNYGIRTQRRPLPLRPPPWNPVPRRHFHRASAHH